MTKFSDEIKEKNIFQGEKLESEAMIIAQKILYGMGLGFIPPTYVKFLKKYNGLKYDGSYLFGATVDDDLDIIDKNEQMERPRNCLILGYNDFDMLCYNYKLKKYQIFDREDFDVLDTFEENELDYALKQIFKV